MWVLIIAVFNPGSGVNNALPLQHLKFNSEAACLEAEKKLNAMTRMGGSNRDVFKAFSVKDS